MRFVVPARDQVDPAIFARAPLSLWREYDAVLCGADWPTVATLNGLRQENGDDRVARFVAQTPRLLADGMHYEQRIAAHGAIATRERNWHDLLNALVWLRYPALKAALNARQVAEIAIAGPKQRTRAQCALTHFDEAGIVVSVRDPALLACWNAHDWHGLFWRERAAWSDGRIAVQVFGHALLEHALSPGQLLVGKALVITRAEALGDTALPSASHAVDVCADAIRSGAALNDPQEMRPLPLSGIPGWHAENGDERFYCEAPCFRPLRAGRTYPAPLSA